MTKKLFLIELEKIKNQIVNRYHPEKIILFGSLARGDYHKDSDIDLLIIKKTDDDPIARIQQLSSLIERNLAVELLVFTPQELQKRLALGDFFLQEVIDQGRTIYETK